jgi:hypothetical protein
MVPLPRAIIVNGNDLVGGRRKIIAAYATARKNGIKRVSGTMLQYPNGSRTRPLANQMIRFSQGVVIEGNHLIGRRREIIASDSRSVGTAGCPLTEPNGCARTN